MEGREDGARDGNGGGTARPFSGAAVVFSLDATDIGLSRRGSGGGLDGADRRGSSGLVCRATASGAGLEATAVRAFAMGGGGGGLLRAGSKEAEFFCRLRAAILSARELNWASSTSAMVTRQRRHQSWKTLLGAVGRTLSYLKDCWWRAGGEAEWVRIGGPGFCSGGCGDLVSGAEHVPHAPREKPKNTKRHVGRDIWELVS